MTAPRGGIRVTATPAARTALVRLRAAGTPVMLVQSAGCCAGSVPMCFADGEYLVGAGDRLLGTVEGCPFYIDARLDEALGEPEVELDVAPGPPEGFSMGAAGDDSHFVTRMSTCPAPVGTARDGPDATG